MVYDKSNVYTTVSADEISERVILQGVYGYFSHDVASLKKAVMEGKTSRYVQYGRLTKIMPDNNRARFVFDRGDFIYTLFYPTDNYLNTSRY